MTFERPTGWELCNWNTVLQLRPKASGVLQHKVNTLVKRQRSVPLRNTGSTERALSTMVTSTQGIQWVPHQGVERLLVWLLNVPAGKAFYEGKKKKEWIHNYHQFEMTDITEVVKFKDAQCMYQKPWVLPKSWYDQPDLLHWKSLPFGCSVLTQWKAEDRTPGTGRSKTTIKEMKLWRDS